MRRSGQSRPPSGALADGGRRARLRRPALSSALTHVGAAIALLSIGFALGACGGDDDGGAGDSASASTASAGAASASPPPGASATGVASASIADSLRAMSYPDDLTAGNRIGKPDAPAAITVFVDFQCPFCLRFTATHERYLIEKYVVPGVASLEVRQFPILGVESLKAAVGAGCAAQQDRYFEFQEELFLVQAEARQHVTERLNVGRFTDQSLAAMAASVGIDTTAWQACYTQGVSVVEADVRAASDAGLRGTPSFIVDGKPLPGVPASEAAWDQVVEQAKNQ